MTFSLPMLIPMIIGVFGGVLSRRVYLLLRKTIANRQEKLLIQQRELSREAYHDLLDAHVRVEKTVYGDVGTETIAG
jgi:hypothetical protein